MERNVKCGVVCDYQLSQKHDASVFRITYNAKTQAQIKENKMNIHAMDMKLPRSTEDITRRDINRNVQRNWNSEFVKRIR
jgi:hypothetical protein